ncbi:MAG TPA: VWA domain-containing protein, partial [Bacteroidetes bacterium]|nr:VWA domain-containing protein [Bacteroidota bacterium]
LWFIPKDYRFYFPEVKMVLRGLALLFLIGALMGPYWGRMEQQIAKLGREVYILVDVSASMNCEDIQPTRLEKVKKDLKRMVARLPGDRIGLIVFTSSAYVQCPLTSDQKAILMFIDLMGTYQFASTGTSFRAAMKMALDRFVNTEKSARKTTRSVILISDGEDFGENFTSVVERMKTNDITLFPVGVGTYAGGQVPKYIRGRKKGYVRTKQGAPAISQLKDETLQDLAAEFGTEYTRIDDQIQNLDNVSNQISLLSATVLDKENRLTSVNRFQILLGGSILCLALSMFWMPIAARRRKEPA